MRILPTSAGLLAAIALLVGAASVRAQSASTIPVGFIKVTVPAASSATDPSYAAVSVPLYKPAVFTGVVSGSAALSGTSFSVVTSGSAAPFTAGQLTSAPHLLHMKSGGQVGRSFLVTNNTTTAITFDTRGQALAPAIAAGDSLEILPAWTLSNLFNPVPFGTGATAAAADNVLLWNGSSWDTFFYNGTAWQSTVGSGDQGGAVIYPDEGIYVCRRATSPLELTLLGTVPSTAEKSELDGATTTFVANRFPVDTTLLATGIHSSPNWRTGATPDEADKVYLWQNGAWTLYFHNGTSWRRADSRLSMDGVAISAGSAVLVTRGNAGISVLAQNLPYTP